MRFLTHVKRGHALFALLCCAGLAACGGGNPDSGSDQSLGPPVQETPPVPSPPIAEAALPTLRFESTRAQVSQADVPVSFGQVFAVGALRPAESLVGRLDGGGALPLQVDVKALNDDGSVRHAIISAVLPALPAGEERKLTLAKSATAQAASPVTPQSLMASGLSASVNASINGVRYSARADDLLKSGKYTTWLAGALANEWHVSSPLATADGAAHPHLAARFAIRWYPAIKKARVDVTVENDWAYEPGPQNIAYDAEILVGAKQVYAKPALNHLHHARWRKVAWWGGDAPAVNIRHDTAYLIGTRALPNYDQGVTIPESSLAALATRWSGAVTEPMAVGLATPYMPTTGGREDIGLLPAWAATWLLSMDKRARDATLGTADLAGSWSSHYRDKNTDRPVSLADYPYMTILGRSTDTMNPATKKYEAFPACASGASCDSPNSHDAPHQPSFAYLPYLLTGDYYYLEELQFWAMWDVFSSNPGYRQNVKGLLAPEQVRGQAWSLRTLAEAAWITPDDDRLKNHFNQILTSNLDWYNQTYTDNPSANALGVIVNGYAIVYDNETGLAPWQDDFFTSAVGHVSDLGFAKARSLLAWKAKFPVSRMTGEGACWIDAAIYAMKVRDSASSAIYPTIGQAYQASHSADFNALACGGPEMAAALKLKVGEMTGYSSYTAGYPSNMQPALAYGADATGAPGKAAWALFMKRTVKPDYGTSPQFAIVPR